MNYKIEDLTLLNIKELIGENDINIQRLEEYFGVTIAYHGDEFKLEGAEDATKKALKAIQLLIETYKGKGNIEHSDVTSSCELANANLEASVKGLYDVSLAKTNSGRLIYPKNENQKLYINALKHSDITFGIGPAGTGKTYLAVVYAVSLLKKNIIKRIVLTRPAVEAGESLGFLPGDLKEKVDPYLRPLYDALYEMLGEENTTKMIEKGTIEIAPLAYMRGRTLNDAYIILDEAQNTTKSQMKMFLTRLGFNSKMAITGDITQIDLPYGKQSGLIQAVNILNDIDNISIMQFSSKDVVRHFLVSKIIKAYEEDEEKSVRHN